MAFVGDFICTRCSEPRHEVVTVNRVCAECRADDIKTMNKARRVYLAGLQGLTDAERIEKLEAVVYDMARDIEFLKAARQAEARY